MLITQPCVSEKTNSSVNKSKGRGKKRGFSKNGNGSGGPRGLSFSQFILMCTINCEKDSPLGQTGFPPEPFPFFENHRFFPHPLSEKESL